jgi:AbrB family looped-hinge helix DNA binding protein
VEATIDAVGRVLVPKELRTVFGLLPGTKVDVSAYGSGIQITPGGRSARLVRENGRLVIDGDLVATDEMMFSLIDAGRK